MAKSRSPRRQRLKGRLALLALRLVGSLPLSLNRALGTLLGWLGAWLPSEALTISRINIGLCFPELAPAAQAKLARAAMIESGKASAEIAFLWQQPDKALPLVRAVEGDQALRETLEDKRPAIILVPHLGCWEVLNFWLSNHFSLHAMFKPSGLDEVDALVKRGREHFGTTMYPATARGVVGLVRVLKREPVLTAILPDQVADKGSGRFAPFFGHTAYTGTLSSKLIQQTGARVFMACAFRLPGTRGFEIRFRDPDPAIYDEDIDQALQGLNRSVESLVREAPAQYLWSYKRFRRSDGVHRNPYK
ncbi:lipid A biosynthesis acyltransferase [Alcanivorax sp. JB21]|uniref:lysophospholipid acyltransferase family protein n=1 Tax=Alcanivorax limicola TaxID=2874102 RepID=UPI001CBE243A|nr:lipid A biosynthesis acyltransferase [Alcanivorax limicola]MBZ2188005.1 lipid A biosynthesis acyltransferase [Alcanivorax limicola]